MLVVRASLRRWLTRNSSEDAAEEREALDARSLLGQHWREWWNRHRRRNDSAIPVEPLDPASARARYREMLQALATSDATLARTPAETPAEYEARLYAYLEEPALSSDGASESLILEELTQAYTRERYGGKHTDQRQRTRLQNRVPQLIARLTGNMPVGEPKRRDRS